MLRNLDQLELLSASCNKLQILLPRRAVSTIINFQSNAGSLERAKTSLFHGLSLGFHDPRAVPFRGTRRHFRQATEGSVTFAARWGGTRIVKATRLRADVFPMKYPARLLKNSIPRIHYIRYDILTNRRIKIGNPLHTEVESSVSW